MEIVVLEILMVLFLYVGVAFNLALEPLISELNSIKSSKFTMPEYSTRLAIVFADPTV
jgi:hypothetical protein